MFKSALVALAVVVSVGSPAPASTPDPYLVYERCVAAMSSSPDPPYESYRLQVAANRINITRDYSSAGMPTTTLHFGNIHDQSIYHVWVRNQDQRSLMQDAVSRALSVNPPTPWQLDFHVPPSRVAPDANESVAVNAVTVNQATKLLSEVEVDHRSDYRITLAGMEQYQGHPAYHLILQSAQGDPNDHPLRELLVDAASYRAWQVVAQVAQRGWLFGGGLTLTANFEPIGPYWLSTSGSIDGGGHYAFVRLHGTYTYLASNFLFPPDLPQSYFDGRHADPHAVAQDPLH